MTGRFGVEAQRAKIVEARKKLDDRERRLDTNEKKKLHESADEAYDRLDRFRVRQGMREVRFDLTWRLRRDGQETGDRCVVVYLDPKQDPDDLKQQIADCERRKIKFEVGTKPLKLALYDLIRGRCERLKVPCVAISEREIATDLGVSERHIRRIVRELERLELIYCFKRVGVETTYAPLLPESERFAEEFEYTLGLWKVKLGERLMHFYATVTRLQEAA